MRRYANKIVWITGASSGLGKSLAEVMAQKGWQVAASARNEAELQALEDWSDSKKGQIHSYPCDITDAGSVETALANIRRDLGPIEMAVLNAGTHMPIKAVEFNAASFRKLIDVNLMGAVTCIDALLQDMVARQTGHIAVVASVAGYRGLATASAYGMTKAGLINMCEAMKPELDLENVKMQVICPGFVRTPLTDKNDFPMPFLMEPDAAAKAFYKGLMSRKFEIIFPWQMGLLMKTLRLLPNWLFFPLAKNFIPDDKTDAETEKASP